MNTGSSASPAVERRRSALPSRRESVREPAERQRSRSGRVERAARQRSLLVTSKDRSPAPPPPSTRAAKKQARFDSSEPVRPAQQDKRPMRGPSGASYRCFPRNRENSLVDARIPSLFGRAGIFRIIDWNPCTFLRRFSENRPKREDLPVSFPVSRELGPPASQLPKPSRAAFR